MDLQKHIDYIKEHCNNRAANKHWFSCCQEIIDSNDFDIEVSLLSPFYQAYLTCLQQENQQSGMDRAIAVLSEYLIRTK